MPLPPTCHCGIFLTIPHEHAQGLAQTGAPLMTLSEFESAEAAEKLIVKGLLAKVGEGLYKPTAHGLKTYFTNTDARNPRKVTP